MERKFITDPFKTLQQRCGQGMEIRKVEEKYFPIANLCQGDYEKNRQGRAIGNCTLSSLCNALAYERANGYDKIPADPKARYEILRQQAKIWMHAPLGRGITVFSNRAFCDRVWLAFGYQGIHSTEHYFCSVSDAIDLARGGRPFLLSMFAGRYGHHTVAVCGYVQYSLGNESCCFLRIQDNWSRQSRYLEEKERIWGVITRWEERKGGRSVWERKTPETPKAAL